MPHVLATNLQVRQAPGRGTGRDEGSYSRVFCATARTPGPEYCAQREGAPAFLPANIANRQKVLANDATFAAFKAAITRLTTWNVIAAILMPDHVHLLIAPLDRDAAVGNASAAIKRFMRQELLANWQWQPGSFDRLLRSDESAEQKWQYTRENPVRAGLVKEWADWPYRIGFE